MCIGQQLIHGLLSGYYFIADVQFAAYCRKINIDPPGIFCFFAKEIGVLYDVGIYRVFEAIGVTGHIELLVFMFGEAYSIITPWFGRIACRLAG